jgi:hypothetical protein
MHSSFDSSASVGDDDNSPDLMRHSLNDLNKVKDVNVNPFGKNDLPDRGAGTTREGLSHKFPSQNQSFLHTEGSEKDATAI